MSVLALQFFGTVFHSTQYHPNHNNCHHHLLLTPSPSLPPPSVNVNCTVYSCSVSLCYKCILIVLHLNSFVDSVMYMYFHCTRHCCMFSLFLSFVCNYYCISYFLFFVIDSKTASHPITKCLPYMRQVNQSLN